jgi:hypothetical protein
MYNEMDRLIMIFAAVILLLAFLPGAIFAGAFFYWQNCFISKGYMCTVFILLLVLQMFYT